MPAEPVFPQSMSPQSMSSQSVPAHSEPSPPMIVSVHIPKTAGTSLGRFLDHAFGKRIMYDYHPGYQNTKIKPDLAASAESGGPYLAETVAVVHGHFYATKYDRVFDNSWTICCFREPVSRVLSQYKHLYFMPADNHPDAKKVQEGGISVVDFAQSQNIGNAQAVHLDGKSVEDLDYVFLTEQLDLGVEVFAETFPGHVASRKVPALNSNKARQESTGRPDMPALSIAEIDELKLACAEDLEVYAKACERHAQQLAECGSITLA